MTTMKGHFFGAFLHGAHFFICRLGVHMRKQIPEKVIDVTGVELTPGKPDVCLGNGEQGFECCCDECNYFLLCFPQFMPKIKED